MVAVIMSTSPCRAASSQDSQKVITAPKIADCMPGVPSRWFFPLKILRDQNPSLKHGIDLEKELYYRQQAASFIHELGSKLQLSHLVMNVAMVYMHRFYVFHSFRRFPRNDVAAACIFLAAKVEEMPRKLEYIVKVSYALQHREEQPLDVKSNRYNEEAQKIITYENILLQTLGFDLTVAVPNQFVVKCIQMVKAPKELAQAAYHFTNDCLHLTTLCLRYRPAVVACASIFLACSWAKWEIPTSHEGKPWYYYVDNEVTKEILEALAEEIVSVYQKCPERLKIKRYMATKREEGGASGPSTSEGGGLDESHDSALYNSITSAIAAAGRPPAPLPNARMKTETESNEAQKFDVITAVEIKPPAVGLPKGVSTVSVEFSMSTDSPEKRQKPETAKVDYKSYIDRMKERRPEQQQKSAVDASYGTTSRKSFMPDVSLATKDLEDPKRYDSRSDDRHGRHRSGHHQERDARTHGDRSRHQGSGNGTYRHEQRPSSKPDSNRHQAEIPTSDTSVKKRHHAEASDDGDDRERKIAKTNHDTDGDHSFASVKLSKEGNKTASTHEGESKPSTLKSGSANLVATVNGLLSDDGRETSLSQKRMGEKASQSRPTSDVSFDRMPDDDTLRQAAQKAEQMLKLQKLEKLRSMNMKLAVTTGSSKGGRDKSSSSRKDTTTSGDSRPPLPASSPPPLPPVPPPPPPPPPPPAS